MHRVLRAGSAAAGLCLAVAASGCSDGQPLAPQDEGPALEARQGALGVQGRRRHMIVLREGTARDLRAEIARAGGRISRSFRDINVVSVEGLSDAAIATLKQHPEVEGVDLDVKVRWIPPASRQFVRVLKADRQSLQAQIDQSGAAFFAQFQWNMKVIRADQAWLKSQQGRNTLVCVLDSGIDPNHIDLAGKVDVDRSVSFVEGEPALVDFAGHGTFVAGLISSNGLGIASVAPDAQLCAIKVLDANGEGSFEDVIAGILYAAQIGADVANMSLGAYFSRNEPGAKELIKAMQRAINFAGRKGVLLVAAAGNDTVNTNRDPRDFIAVPAELDHVISVGATAPIAQMNFDQIASYSNFGKSGVDVFAPGGDFVDGSVIEDLILAPCSASIVGFDCADGVTYLFGAGTSFAAPHVSGEGAVIQSQLPGHQDDGFLTACILISADPVTSRRIDPLYDWGRIDVLGGAKCEPSGRGHHFLARWQQKGGRHTRW